MRARSSAPLTAAIDQLGKVLAHGGMKLPILGAHPQAVTWLDLVEMHRKLDQHFVEGEQSVKHVVPVSMFRSV